jgi:hypothetical protein
MLGFLALCHGSTSQQNCVVDQAAYFMTGKRKVEEEKEGGASHSPLQGQSPKGLKIPEAPHFLKTPLPPSSTTL